MKNGQLDRRVRATRVAIVRSFNRLVLGRRFDDISVGDVVADAGVGRSTFYEHFSNKDELFRRSVATLLAPLADAATERADAAAVRGVLEHIRENRARAGTLLYDEPGRMVSRVLAELIESRLAGERAERSATLAIPIRTIAAQAADGLMALIRTWLADRAPCTAQELALVMIRGTRAVVAAGG